MLKAFQLRAARSVCGIGVRDIGLYLGVSGAIVSRWEQKLPLEDISSQATNPSALNFFFEQHNILFPSDNSIKFNDPLQEKISEHLTRFQLRAARVALLMSQLKLADLTNTTRPIINYLETQSNMTFLNSTRKIVDDLNFKLFFEENGILFPDNTTVQVVKNKNIG